MLWSSVGFLSIHTLTVSTSVPSLVGGECDDLDGILFRIIVSRPRHSGDEHIPTSMYSNLVHE